jgi:hypothetical protein
VPVALSLDHLTGSDWAAAQARRFPSWLRLSCPSFFHAKTRHISIFRRNDSTMRTHTTLATAALLAGGALLGWLTIPTVGQEMNRKPGAKAEGLRLTHDQLPVDRGQVERPINIGIFRVGVEELQVPVLGHGVNQRARVGLTEPGY